MKTRVLSAVALLPLLLVIVLVLPAWATAALFGAAAAVAVPSDSKQVPCSRRGLEIQRLLMEVKIHGQDQTSQNGR